MHHVVSTHTIQLDAPVERCQRFFTPAGEELWVEGWRPTYLHPADGSTRRGMVFTTGSGEDHTIWTLADFDTQPHRARYLRVTPASRCAVVEVLCMPEGPDRTSVTVTYSVTALHAEAAPSLEAYRGAAFVDMIEGWRAAIEERLPRLSSATIA
jgi:hypothetical protein